MNCPRCGSEPFYTPNEYTGPAWFWKCGNWSHSTIDDPQPAKCRIRQLERVAEAVRAKCIRPAGEPESRGENQWEVCSYHVCRVCHGTGELRSEIDHDPDCPVRLAEEAMG